MGSILKIILPIPYGYLGSKVCLSKISFTFFMFLLKIAIPDPQKLLFEIKKGPIFVENQISSQSRPSPSL